MADENTIKKIIKEEIQPLREHIAQLENENKNLFEQAKENEVLKEQMDKVYQENVLLKEKNNLLNETNNKIRDEVNTLGKKIIENKKNVIENLQVRENKIIDFVTNFLEEKIENICMQSFDEVFNEYKNQIKPMDKKLLKGLIDMFSPYMLSEVSTQLKEYQEKESAYIQKIEDLTEQVNKANSIDQKELMESEIIRMTQHLPTKIQEEVASKMRKADSFSQLKRIYTQSIKESVVSDDNHVKGIAEAIKPEEEIPKKESKSSVKDPANDIEMLKRAGVYVEEN